MRVKPRTVWFLGVSLVFLNITAMVGFIPFAWKLNAISLLQRMDYKKMGGNCRQPVTVLTNCTDPNEDLVGNVTVNLTTAVINYWNETLGEVPAFYQHFKSYFMGPFEHLKWNGTLLPNSVALHQTDSCSPNHTVAVIVPFRDREEHLTVLLGHLLPILRRQQIRFSVFVTEQVGNGTFNKGRLMNTAFEFARAVGAIAGAPYDCFIFQDVDMLVEQDTTLYRCSEGKVVHYATMIDKYEYKRMCCWVTVGGVVGFGEKEFRKVNGYPNSYWGWGGEDDEMDYRIKFRNLTVLRPPAPVGRYTMIKHERDYGNPVNPKRRRHLHTWKSRLDDGLSQLDTKIVGLQKYALFTKVLVDVGIPPPD